MRIRLMSIMVNDQDKALKVYTEKLGFTKKIEIPMGAHKWLTVVPGEEPDGVQLLLEPMAFEPAKVYQKALFDSGIPIASFNVTNIEAEYSRLKELGIKFSMAPTAMGPAKLAVFEDTCGNHIQIAEV